MSETAVSAVHDLSGRQTWSEHFGRLEHKLGFRSATRIANVHFCRAFRYVSSNGRRYSEPSDESQVRKDPFDRASDHKNARRVYAPSASVRLPSSTIGDAPADSVQHTYSKVLWNKS